MNEEQNIPNQKSKGESEKSKAESSHFLTDSNTSIQHQTSENESQTENMETHAHHLHKTPGQGWKHYLFEFLMLFLAVFCGFLAENQRERIVEYRQEKQYIRSLLNDLVSDTLKIQETVASNDDLMNGLDSLATSLDYTNLTDSSLKEIYDLNFRWVTGENIVTFTERTISQLKNAGGMRLISNQKVSDAVTKYYELVSVCEKQANYYSKDITSLYEISYKLFDKYYTKKNHANMILAKQLMLNNPFLMKEYLNRVLDLREVIATYNGVIMQMTAVANAVMKLIRTEYHLESK